MVIPIKIVSFVIELNYSNTMYGKMKDFLSQTLAEIKEAGLYKEERLIESAQQAAITVKGKEVLNFCANNYLGLSNHPRLIKASQEMMNRRGYGMSSVRFICGTQDIHKELEDAISDYFQTEDTILYAACFDANGGVFEPLFSDQDAIISDSLNHASIIDGVRLCKAKRYRYANADMAALERCLQEAQAQRHRIIATDGVFSMEGDLANLPEIVRLKHKYNATIMVDEAHGLGVFGKQGRGVCDHFGLTHEVDLIMGTFSKSLASIGGFIAADSSIINWLRHNARTYIFSASNTPAATASALEALHIIQNEPERLNALWEATNYALKRFREAGFEIGATESPIIPLYVRDTEKTFMVTKLAFDEGVFINPVIPPACAPQDTLVRVALMATHTKEQIDSAVEKLVKAFKALDLL